MTSVKVNPKSLLNLNHEPLHGHSRRGSRSPTYYSWLKMRERCNNLLNNRYYRYGGRGIKVCEQWNTSFEAFLADMGVRPEGMTLDRIDDSEDYTPENCRWADRFVQARSHVKHGRYCKKKEKNDE